MKYHKSIMNRNCLTKSFVTFLIVFISIALNAPVYHQHGDDHHPDQSTHTHNIDSHHPNDYTLTSHKKELINEVLPDESHQTHYHAHFEKSLYGINRIVSKIVETVSDVELLPYNNFSNQPPVSIKLTYHPYRSIFYSKTFAKTSSGLSPPVYS